MLPKSSVAEITLKMECMSSSDIPITCKVHTIARVETKFRETSYDASIEKYRNKINFAKFENFAKYLRFYASQFRIHSIRCGITTLWMHNLGGDINFAKWLTIVQFRENNTGTKFCEIFV
jgi:hypothetical protein